jgi:hypothetical protein
MNAGPDVERLIADWLVEEAPARAPDRILDSAAKVIDRTKQRRFAAAWREPMTFSIGRLVAATVILGLAVVGGGLVGRSTSGMAAPEPTTPSPSAVPTANRSTVTLDAYRAARDAVCVSLTATATPLKDHLPGIYDVSTTPDLRGAKIIALTEFVALQRDLVARLEAITPPDALVAEHAANVEHERDILIILTSEIGLLQPGRLAEAQAVDKTTDPIGLQVAAFEQKYGLSRCP